jgi:predicted dehydrogenase
MSRRVFLGTAAATGAGLALGSRVLGAAAGPRPDDINIAMIGVGTQGRVLMQSWLKLPGIRCKAVCDIWPYYRDYVVRILQRYKHDAKAYTDYREMLADQDDLDAVIVATPDWVHAEHTVACLQAGLHVYCEKEMSNSLSDARRMVTAARESGKLLQIGHQRRSNPRYHIALDYVRNKKALGRPAFVQAHWNRHQILQRGWPKGRGLDEATLEKYGYGTMERFRNWRWYRKFAAGPIADLGSHQIDIFHWFLGALPVSVVATGGADNYEGIEWYDNVHALYEWHVPWDCERKVVRGFYQTLGTTSHGGYRETFMGNEGSLIVSEFEGVGGMRREKTAPLADWEKPLQAELQDQASAEEEAAADASPAETDEEADLVLAEHSVPDPGRYYPPIAGMDKPVHMPHLENFFAAVRGEAKLTSPGEEAYRTCVSVLRVNDSVAAGRPVEFKPEDFEA